MDNFENLLGKEILTSLNTHPELWTSSIMGIRRDDGLDLSLGTFSSISSVSVHSPYKYEFKDEAIRKNIWKTANDILEEKRNKKYKEAEKDNKKNLSIFLKLDSRKNKLIELQKINSTNDGKKDESNSIDNEKKNELKKGSFFHKLINKLL